MGQARVYTRQVVRILEVTPWLKRALAERGHEAQDACVLNRALLGRSWGGSGRREAESHDLLPHRPAGGVRRSCWSLKLATRRVSVHFHDLQYTRTAFPLLGAVIWAWPPPSRV